MSDSPRPTAAADLQSTVTLLDFLRAWHRFRVAFVIGLLVVGGVTFGWTKFVRVPYFKSTVYLSLSESFTATSKAGVADTKLFEANRSDKYLVFQTIFAEQSLYSRELILEAAAALKNPADGAPAVDLYELLDVREEDPARRDALLVQIVRDDLMNVVQLQNSGVMSLSIEMPDPAVAARFATVCIEVLKRRFTELNFSYLDSLVALYHSDLQGRLKQREQMAAELQELLVKHRYDLSPQIAQRRSALQEQLRAQAEALGTLNTQISQLELAVNPRAKEAAQPVKVITAAFPALKKSRPKTILSTLMAMALYTFACLVGLAAFGFLEAGLRQSSGSSRRSEVDAPSTPSRP